MADEPQWFEYNYRIADRRPTPGELLFEFVRVSDQAPMPCELRFHGESYGWEAQFLERGELLLSRGAFVTRAVAVRWAEEMRHAMESERWPEPLPPVPIA
jgi:hypothetical protein